MTSTALAPKFTVREASLKPQLTLASFHSTPVASTRRNTIVKSDHEHLARDGRALRTIERDYGVQALSG